MTEIERETVKELATLAANFNTLQSELYNTKTEINSGIKDLSKQWGDFRVSSQTVMNNIETLSKMISEDRARINRLEATVEENKTYIEKLETTLRNVVALSKFFGVTTLTGIVTTITTLIILFKRVL